MRATVTRTAVVDSFDIRAESSNTPRRRARPAERPRELRCRRERQERAGAPFFAVTTRRAARGRQLRAHRGRRLQQEGAGIPRGARVEGIAMKLPVQVDV